MSRIIFNLVPGGAKGQESHDARIEKAKKYIELIESEGTKIVSTEFTDTKVIIITED